MLPPRLVLTIKKHFGTRLWIVVVTLAAAMAWGTGCTPPGPRALLDGKRLIEQGKYAPAVEKLKLATSLLQTNAQAWNYLGLAYHHAGQPAYAMEAYQKATKLDRDLLAAHYNLGCLYLEQNRLDLARDELTTYTLRQPNSVAGLVKLGTAQLRLGGAQVAAAEKSFGEALKLDPRNAEALNNLGMVQAQRGRWSNTVGYFSEALKAQPDYGPAMLNLAVVWQSAPNTREQALQKYREYLALNPRPANYDAVSAVARQLDLELNPAAARSVAANPTPVPPRASAPTNTPRQETPAPPVKMAAATPAKPVTSSPPQLPPPSQPADSQPSATVPSESAPVQDAPAAPAETTDTAQAKPAKKSFFQRLNPFQHQSPKQAAAAPPTPQVEEVDMSDDQNKSAGSAASKTAAPPVPVARYKYISPAKPPSGNRPEAERLFTQAAQAQREGRVADAVQDYRSAVQADPSFFEAEANLGLAAYDAGEMGLSLWAHEMALAINPSSFNARYNFALALKKSGYIVDSAQELERLLVVNPGETPAHLASAHLMLGNLYSEQFHQPKAARPHYAKVLELDPQNNQATAIRYWLKDNP